MGGVIECLSDLHLSHQTEPRHQYIYTEDRSDTTMLDPNTGQNLVLDVSLAHPWSQNIIRTASRENGHTATTREDNIIQTIFRRACSMRLYIKMCFSCDKHFERWDSKQRMFCSICHNSL